MGSRNTARAILNRAKRVERRQARELRRWAEDTEHILQVSALVLVPLVIAIITWVSNVSPLVSFLIYPPLASGTYTLFADPGSRYANPRTFVGGMTAGAVSGWIALEASARFLYAVPPAEFEVHAGAAALGIFLTGAVTWLLDLEVPTAYSASLLVLVTASEELSYVAGIVGSSIVVAGVFVVWRDRFYHERARYLFQSTRGDDQVLVPVRDATTASVALFAARLAAAHEAGRIVLLATVAQPDIEAVAGDYEDPADGGDRADPIERAESELRDQAIERLDRLRARIEREVEIACEFVVAVEDGSPGQTVLATAADEGCDLIVCPYETEADHLSGVVRTILAGQTDAIVVRPADGRTDWERILVLVRSPGEIANAMLEFAHRLVRHGGTISACTCISRGRDRRAAEVMLEEIVGPQPDPIETRIAHGAVEEFLGRTASAYDLAVIGASTDRSPASRLVSVPTFERIHELDCDLAIVHRG